MNEPRTEATNPEHRAQLEHTRLVPTGLDSTRDAYQGQMEERKGKSRAGELHNAPTLLLSLPDELILDIAFYVRDATFGSAAQPQHYPWDVSMTVCRRLRNIITSSLSLHTRLSNVAHSTDYLERSLARSNPLPMDLFILDPSQYEGDGMHRWMNILQSHGRRIRVLSCRIVNRDGNGIASWLPHLSHLRSFSFHYDVDKATRRVTRLARTMELSALLVALTAGGVPKVDHLASLAMDGLLPPCGIETHTTYQKIMVLSLSNIYFDINDLESFKAISLAASGLEKLAIRRVNLKIFANESSLPVLDASSFRLPTTLRVLEYSGSKRAEFFLLQRIIPLDSARLVLTWHDPTKKSALCIRTVLWHWMGPEHLAKEAALRVTNKVAGDRLQYATRLRLWSTCKKKDADRLPDIEYNGRIHKTDPFEDMMAGPSYESLRRLSLCVDETSYSLLQNWKYGLDSWTPSLRHLSILLHPVSEPRLSNEVFYFCEWLRHRRAVTRRALHALTISREMVNALDRLAPSRLQDFGSLRTGEQSAPEDVPSWRDAVSKIHIVSIR
ncbi:unnamed protein product [Peniophora sp. CBMAI 1063]|nr:unnamed protein product [Peniophora sp. CBMAI 1063]